MLPVLHDNNNAKLYEQLYLFYKKSIHDRKLKSGDKMKSVRSLASELGISNNTVIKCYEQLLDEGYLISLPRKGLFVNDLEELKVHANTEPDKSTTAKLKQSKIKYNLGRSVVDEDRFPMKEWRRAQQLALDYLSFQYVQYDFHSETTGLKEQLVKYLYQTRGVLAEKDQVVIAAGCNSLFSLLALMFKKTITDIVFEEPGFEHARFLFEKFDYIINTIEVDSNGIKTGPVLKKKNCLIYLTPSHQYPTGAVMPAANRITLLNWAQKSNSYIIEDDYDSIFRHKNKPLPALQSIDVNSRVIYIGTFSKLFIPSLRVAYMVLPRQLATEMSQYSYFNYTVPYQTQRALAIFMEAGHLERHIRRMQKVYKDKYYLTLHYITEIFKDLVNIIESEVGLSILIEIKTSKTEDELIDLARAKRIALRGAAVTYYHRENVPRYPHIFIGFGNIPAKEIPTVLQTLKKAWFEN